MALDTETSTPQRMSMDDIAASMLVQADPVKPQEAPAVEQDDDDFVADSSVEDELLLDSDEDTGVADSDDAVEADDENFETFQLTDDVLIPVTVDGEAKEVTLADLKRAYSGEGAIEKRLQIATETKKEAESLRVQVEQELNSGRQNLVKAFAAFESMMFQPQVRQPDPALQRTNPTQYLLQLESWRAEQGELQAKRQKVQQAVSLYQQQEAQQKEQARAEAAQRLVEVMPVLRDPVKGPEVQKMMLEGAYAYGFTDADLAEVVDERMYLVLSDAAAYRRLKAKGQAAPQQPKKTAPVMRPGATRAVASATTSARQQKTLMETARKTGRIDDVAATMLVRKPKR